MSAPMQGEVQPSAFRFKLGGFEVATILDSKAIREGLHPLYGANTTAAEVQALAGAIGNAGGPGLPRDGDAAWTQCWEHLIAARAALDALLTPAAPTPTGDA